MTGDRKIILCADDFAISSGTSEVIARLARGGSINAISCMAASRYWQADAGLLHGIEKETIGEYGPVEVGIHLVMASERPLSKMTCVDDEGRLPGPDRLLAMILAGQISPSQFAKEIDRQFIAFASTMGRPPAFVDAHQHVHVYPLLRKLVIEATKKHAPYAWIRVPTDQLSALMRRPFMGKAIGSAAHSLGMRTEIARHGLRANSSFAGHYDFGTDYARFLPRFFENAANFHVIMCHPGSDELPDDPIADARCIEASVLGEMKLAERIDRYAGCYA